MSRHKAIIFDVDGVALNSPKEKLPSKRLAEAVGDLRDEYYLSAATGRPWACVVDTVQFLGLVDPCIVAAGTQIRDPQSGEVLWECAMEPQDVDAVMAILKNMPNCRLIYNDYSPEDYASGGVRAEQIMFSEAVYYLNCIFVEPDEAPVVIEKLSVVENLAITLAVSQKAGYKDILITHKLATKEHAVAELLKMIHVARGDAIGVGDGHNDIELFRAVGRKIAVGNAVPELKAAADEVIGDIEHDGFAEFLEGLK